VIFKPARNEMNMELLDTLLENNPMLSQNRLSNELGISQASVCRALKDLAYHPYKLQLTHELLLEDLGARLEFSLSQLEIIDRVPNFVVDILFSDEAYFNLHGGVNRHNCRYYAKENPHWEIGMPIHSPQLHVWAGVCSRGIIGPYFFEESVTSEVYAGMSVRTFYHQYH
jgi:hypothetical protein